MLSPIGGSLGSLRHSILAAGIYPGALTGSASDAGIAERILLNAQSGSVEFGNSFMLAPVILFVSAVPTPGISCLRIAQDGIVNFPCSHSRL